MERNGMLRRSFVCVLVMAIMVSMFLPVGAMAKGRDGWEGNVLCYDPLSKMTNKKENIVRVVFLDNLEDAPVHTYHLGKGGSDKVQGWAEWGSGSTTMYIAAEGGINAKIACDDLFSGCESLEEIEFNGVFHTGEAESMTNMFRGCYALEELDLSDFDTSNVTTMHEMFRECGALEELDVSSFDTSNVKTMYCMFSTCTSLLDLDLSSFDTSSVTNMGYMFSACRNLEAVDVADFDTRKVTNMEGMFRWCGSLVDYDFSHWKVNRVRNYHGFMDDGMKINGRDWECFFR